MIAIDFLLKTFFVYLYKRNEKGLQASIFLLSVALGLNMLTLIIYVSGIFFPGLIRLLNPLGFGVLVVIGLYLTDKFIRRAYVTNGREITPPKLKPIFYLLGPMYYVGSAVLFFISFRYI
jgi:hypothetical protein